ncbi:hypothetical protein ACFPMF_01820 [Larkinella bovis]|uniref:Uncharacterized protein n=1 Tax=Larkinella bovis TaxID=683041 RepID=A0ABW0I400_9BACT
MAGIYGMEAIYQGPNSMALKLSKTEALILARALDDAKYSFTRGAAGRSKTASLQMMRKLNELQDRLEKHSEDGRLHHRIHTRQFWDRLRWWVFGKFDEWKLPQDPKQETGDFQSTLFD